MLKEMRHVYAVYEEKSFSKSGKKNVYLATSFKQNDKASRNRDWCPNI